MAQITINDEDIYYDHVYCTVGDFSKQQSTRKITWYLDGNEYHSVTLLGSTARTSYNIRGLKPSTSYQISVKMVSNQGSAVVVNLETYIRNEIMDYCS